MIHRMVMVLSAGTLGHIELIRCSGNFGHGDCSRYAYLAFLETRRADFDCNC